MRNETLKQAVLWDAKDEKKIRCKLCSHRCTIAEGKLGFCKVRKNIDGCLYSLNYDKVISANPDPIEKKPLFHFQPGSESFSIATMGCNFRCDFCQNWQISQAAIESGGIDGRAISPDKIVESAKQSGCKSIAYTYTEPTVFIELCAETGKLAKENGLSNVFVSNGYMTREAIEFAKDWLDGINIDLKAFTDDYYTKLCKAKLEPVRDTIRTIAKETDIWMEITTLIVPDENDSPEELKQLATFIANEAGPHVPWHISRFVPQYHYLDSTPTPTETIHRALEIGKNAGLYYVYPGNLYAGKDECTFCHNCGELLIERSGYTILANHIENKKCPKCSTKTFGYEL